MSIVRRKVWTFNVAVDFWRHPKAVQAGRDGRDLFLCALGWSGEFRQDGRLPRETLEQLAALVGISAAAARKAAERLEAVGLLEPTGEGWLIHDYLEWQMSAAERDARAEANAERQRQWKAKKLPKRERSNAPGNALPNASTNGADDDQRGVSVSEPLDPSVAWLSSSSSKGGSGGTTTNEHPSDPIGQALHILGRHDAEKAQADGIHILTMPLYQAECTNRRELSDSAALAKLAADHPDWTAEQLADHRLGRTPAGPPPPHCDRCGTLGHPTAACPDFPDLEAHP